MAQEINLRPYQEVAIEKLRENIRDGVINQLLCAPTGAGKTVLASFLIQECYKKMKRAVFVVDRVNLIDQTSAVFDGYGIRHGVMQADHWRHRPWERVQLCSAQTLARRTWPEADLIIVDECHTISRTVAKRIGNRDTIVVGLTATPFTKGLGKLYDRVVNVTATQTLIDDGFLANYRIFACQEPNMDGVRVIAGEWEEKETSKRALEVVGDCVAEYIKHCNGKKFICSAVDTAHVEALNKQFMEQGVICANYTYKVGDAERAEIIKEFRKPDSYIKGIITVTAATKGFDVPDIECVIMARPLRKSLAEHIQFLGRGLRVHPNKKECIVLDHSGNCMRFMDDMLEFFQNGCNSLDDGSIANRKKKVKEDIEDKYIKCPMCKCLHAKAPFCPNCGHEYPKKQGITHKAGTLTELIASGNRRAMTVEIWSQIVKYASEKKAPEKAEKYALALYKNMTGTWPTQKFSQTIPADSVSEDIVKKIKYLSIKWMKGRQKGRARA